MSLSGAIGGFSGKTIAIELTAPLTGTNSYNNSKVILDL